MQQNTLSFSTTNLTLCRQHRHADSRRKLKPSLLRSVPNKTRLSQIVICSKFENYYLMLTDLNLYSAKLVYKILFVIMTQRLPRKKCSKFYLYHRNSYSWIDLNHKRVQSVCPSEVDCFQPRTQTASLARVQKFLVIFLVAV